MHQMTWDGIIERANKGRFNDILIEQEDIHKRGPIKRIYRDGMQIVFETLWMACKDHGNSDWQNRHCTGIRVSDELRPEADIEGSITFFVPSVGKVQIFSTARRNSRLDPSEVNGLEADDVRQSRAREYQLPLEAS